MSISISMFPAPTSGSDTIGANEPGVPGVVVVEVSRAMSGWLLLIGSGSPPPAGAGVTTSNDNKITVPARAARIPRGFIARPPYLPRVAGGREPTIRRSPQMLLLGATQERAER